MHQWPSEVPRWSVSFVLFLGNKARFSPMLYLAPRVFPGLWPEMAPGIRIGTLSFLIREILLVAMFTFFASTFLATGKLSRSKVYCTCHEQFVLFYTLCKKYLMKYCRHQNCKIAECQKESWAIHSSRNFGGFLLIVSPKHLRYIGLKCWL